MYLSLISNHNSKSIKIKKIFNYLNLNLNF